MPAIYHEGSWLGNATDPEVLVKDTVGWTGKNRAFSQTNNAVIAHIENGITYDVSWTGSATITLKKNSASGATITSGSTSPLRFTADADYELYFGSSATVTNIMVKDSRITDPAYEPYHESVQNQLNAQGVLGAKNLLQITATTRTQDGVTITVNKDSSDNVLSVVLNGTATSSGKFNLNNTSGLLNSLLQKYGDLIWSGCPSRNDCRMYTHIQNGSYVTLTNGEEKILSASNNYDTNILIQYDNGITYNNVAFYPMLRLASDPDDTYQPYAMTNRELTENVIDLSPTNIKSTFFSTIPENVQVMNEGNIVKFGGMISGNIIIKSTNGYSFSNAISLGINAQYKPLNAVNSFGIILSGQWQGSTGSELGYAYIGGTTMELKTLSSTTTDKQFFKFNFTYAI